MMRKIRVGEGCAFSSQKPKRLYRYISLLAVLTSMCLYAAKQVSAQQAEPAAAAGADIAPLQIGDTISDYLWHLPLQVVNHPEGKATITLDEYRGKLIILDFWATRCTACIQSMPKAATINYEYDDVNVILATREPTAKAREFFAKRASDSTWDGLTSIVDDSLLAGLFPHRLIPHVVWIDSAGRLTATTGA